MPWNGHWDDERHATRCNAPLGSMTLRDSRPKRQNGLQWDASARQSAIPHGQGSKRPSYQMMRLQNVLKFIRFCFTFPDHHHPPSKTFKGCSDALVSSTVVFEFFEPEVRLGLGNSRDGTILMTVPETTMDQNNCAILGKGDVRLSGQVSPVKAKAPSSSVQCLANGYLRLRVFALKPGHQRPSLIRAHCRHTVRMTKWGVHGQHRTFPRKFAFEGHHWSRPRNQRVCRCF